MSEITAAATFCATLVDEWTRAGVQHAVVAPGSRSTPLALALADDDRMTVHVHHDERSAGFLALGIGAATNVPAVVLTTSGTAAAELHPAVVEAHQGAVPMIVCTADRPPELQAVGAPQTIDQTHLYGRAVRWYADPGGPDDRQASTWRSLASRAVMEATSRRPGPVHLNLPFRDPLVGTPGPLPPARDGGAPWHERGVGLDVLVPDQIRTLQRMLEGRRGVIVAGPGMAGGAGLHRLAERLGWPVLAVPRSDAWADHPTVVTRADAILRTSFASDHVPEVILHLGGLITSRVVEEWLAASGAPQVAVLPPAEFPDPGHRIALAVEAEAGRLCSALAESATTTDPAWLDDWQAAQAAAQKALVEALAAHPEPTEPAVARDVVATLPDRSQLVVASSMPVRDVEWYADPRDGVCISANRGANGIDGVVSTAVGAAVASQEPTVALVGDVAFLHDTNALLGLAARDVDLTIVVIDNDGGGIFSFLPPAGELDRERFELLFGTPHGVDATALAAAHGLDAEVLETQAEVGPAVAKGGTRVLVVRTDRAANVAVHDEINAAVAAALG